MAADRQATLARIKQYVPIGVKRRVRKTLPDKYRRLWDPDWHRRTVRGTDAFWDSLGKLQLDYLVEQGLKPEHYVLDVGCGPLRAGVHFIGYLEPGHYAGIDKRGDTLMRARDVELPRYGLADKNPNILVNGAFEFTKLGQTFDYAIAQSVFTHLPEDLQRAWLDEQLGYRRVNFTGKLRHPRRCGASLQFARGLPANFHQQAIFAVPSEDRAHVPHPLLNGSVIPVHFPLCPPIIGAHRQV